MNNKNCKRIIAFFISCTLMISSALPLAAAETDSRDVQKIKQDIEDTVEKMDESDKQLCALNMLNHLTVLTSEINESSNSQLYLNNAYSSLINNTRPEAIDEDSKYEIESLLETIEEYQNIEKKRERLEYIYEQNQAQKYKKAIPSPMSILNVVQSKSLLKGLISVVFLAVDAKSSYDSYVSEIEKEYMEEGWVLDDAATANLNKSRSNAFFYMVDMCQKYNIDSDLALTDETASDFADYENTPNITRRLNSLKEDEKVYKGYGKYWLVLAETYYEAEKYEECLDAIKKYEDMNIVTFRYDHDYAKALTLAITAAKEIQQPDEYIKTAEKYLDRLLANTENDEWSLRYFAALTYLDLYANSGKKNKDYLQEAYRLTKGNVNRLIDEQHAQNDAYLAEIQKVTPGKYDSAEKKKEIKSYNKWLAEERKTELPPTYQPLVLNCELLWNLAKELKISDADKKELDDILHGDGTLFLIPQLENKFWFSKNPTMESADLTFDGKKLDIPANLLEQGTTVKVTIESGTDSTLYDDWTLNQVDRKKQTAVENFTAKYSSKDIKKHNYKDGDKVRVEIIPLENSPYDKLTYTFDVSVEKKLKFFDDIKFTLEK